MNLWFKHIVLCLLSLLVQATSDDIAIFYNVYIPPQRSADHAAKNIVKEQLKQRDNSIVSNVPLYYVTIGRDIGEFENCSNCHRIKHYNEASEIETLSHLHEYCTTHQDEKVVYMHSKGSFHKGRHNDDFRHMLNKAIFSDDCLLLKTPPATNTTSAESSCKCNICSARFSPIPFHHMTGNMWVAECSYISKLMHPSKIRSTMNEMIVSFPKEKFSMLEKCKDWETGVN